jgi:hypothetical protein
MFLVAMVWLGTSGTLINPVGGNTTITNQYSTAFTNVKWLAWLMLPFTGYIIADKGFDIRHKKERERDESEPEEEE